MALVSAPKGVEIDTLETQNEHLAGRGAVGVPYVGRKAVHKEIVEFFYRQSPHGQWLP